MAFQVFAKLEDSRGFSWLCAEGLLYENIFWVYFGLIFHSCERTRNKKPLASSNITLPYSKPFDDSMSGHGEDGENPLHKTEKLDLSFNPEERQGLTTEQVEELYKQWGFNELPEIKVSLWWLLFIQFTGTMPYMLELAAVIAIAVQDYSDFGIILGMLLANGFLSFHEQLKAAESLVR